MDESTKAKIAGLLEQAEQEAEQRGYTAGLAAGTEAAKRVTPYEEPFGPYEDNSMEARLRRHQELWGRVGNAEEVIGRQAARITELEAEVARLQAEVPAVHTGSSIREEAIAAPEKKPKKGGAK